MVERYRAAYWTITHFNLFIADIPLTGHMHTPEKHEPWQKQGHRVTLDRSHVVRNVQRTRELSAIQKHKEINIISLRTWSVFRKTCKYFSEKGRKYKDNRRISSGRECWASLGHTEVNKVQFVHPVFTLCADIVFMFTYTTNFGEQMFGGKISFRTNVFWIWC